MLEFLYTLMADAASTNHLVAPLPGGETKWTSQQTTRLRANVGGGFGEIGSGTHRAVRGPLFCGVPFGHVETGSAPQNARFPLHKAGVAATLSLGTAGPASAASSSSDSLNSRPRSATVVGSTPSTSFAFFPFFFLNILWLWRRPACSRPASCGVAARWRCPAAAPLPPQLPGSPAPCVSDRCLDTIDCHQSSIPHSRTTQGMHRWRGSAPGRSSFSKGQ